MLATHPRSQSLHFSPTPTLTPCLLSSPRPALGDSTNVNSRSNACSSGREKSFVYPTSSVRTGSAWSDVESCSGSLSPSFHSRHHHLSSTPSPFPVTYKAPPTVSISLSAACSSGVKRDWFCGSGAQGLEPDLLDVTSVVPFPSTTLDGCMDVEMFDASCVPGPGPNGHSLSAPRKRRSAHSSVSSSQGSLGKGAKQKRPRKSKRQVAELWWLGVVHQSILRSIEARQSARELDSSDTLLSGPCDFDTMDRVLVEKIQRRLAENGCTEGRALPSPLSRISSPSISVPSLNLLAPIKNTLPTDSTPLAHSPESTHITLDGTTTPSPASPCASSSVIPYSRIPFFTSMSHRRRHVRFDIPQHPGQSQSQSHPSIPRRSPSPPARTGTVPSNVTLTMPQLVASLTLAYHERAMVRGRSSKPPDCRKNAGRSLPSAHRQVIQCDDNDNDAIQEKDRSQQSSTLRARLSSAPERKSPLSRVVYAES